MKYELIKLFTNKTFMLFLALATSANIVLCVSAANNYASLFFSTPAEYKALYLSLPADDIKAKEVLEKNMEDIDETEFASAFADRAVLAEVNERLSYQEYLDGVFANAQNVINTSIFFGSSAYSKKNAEKTRDDFKNMVGVKPLFSPSAGIRTATSGLYTDVFVIAVILFAALILFTYEREKNMLVLSRCTQRGGAYHASAKLLSIAVLCGACIFVFYLTKLLMCAYIFSLGDLSHPLQSVYGYTNSTFRVNVGVFLLLYYLLKMFSLLGIAALFAFLSNLCRRTIYAYAAMAAGVFATFTHLWINSEIFLTKYYNVNFFGMPVSRTTILVAVLGIGVIALAILTVIVYAASSVKESGRGKNKGFSRGNLLVSEGYKLLFECRAAKILLCFAVALVYMAVFMPVRETFPDGIDDMYYKRIAVTQQGEISAELKSEILYAVAEAKHTNGLLQAKIQDRLDYLETKEGSVFFYERGLEKLTFGDFGDEIPLFIVAVIVVSACLLSFNSVEKKTSTTYLIKATKSGFRRSRACKYLISLTVITLVYLALYIPYYYMVLSAYGTYGLSAAAYSLEHLAFVPATVSCFHVLIVCAAVRLMLLYIIGALSLCKSN